MDIENYFNTLNLQSQQIFSESMDKQNYLGLIHDFAISLNDWTKALPKSEPNQLIKQSIEELEISGLMLLGGFYRPAYANLRLSIEELLGSIFFSTDLLKFSEWKNGGQDMNWSSIIELENGILSKRYANAFFPELKGVVNSFNELGRKIYRELSEFVHGNYSTWDVENPTLMINESLILKYEEILRKYIQLAHFSLCVRHLKNDIKPENLESLETHVMDAIGHVEEIRIFFGGQK